MSTRFDDFEKHCRQEFAELHTKLDRLDEAMRGTPGNGNPGVKVRLDRLEQAEARRKRLTWVVIGACASAGASFVLQLSQIVLGTPGH